MPGDFNDTPFEFDDNRNGQNAFEAVSDAFHIKGQTVRLYMQPHQLQSRREKKSFLAFAQESYPEAGVFEGEEFVFIAYPQPDEKVDYRYWKLDPSLANEELKAVHQLLRQIDAREGHTLLLPQHSSLGKHEQTSRAVQAMANGLQTLLAKREIPSSMPVDAIGDADYDAPYVVDAQVEAKTKATPARAKQQPLIKRLFQMGNIPLPVQVSAAVAFSFGAGALCAYNAVSLKKDGPSEPAANPGTFNAPSAVDMEGETGKTAAEISGAEERARLKLFNL